MGISEEGQKKDILVFQTKFDEYRVTSIVFFVDDRW